MLELALIGRTLSHSFSARYFNDKFQSEGLDLRYINLELAQIDELPRALAKHPALIGFNVTIPYKEAILPYLDSLSPQAAKIGVVNTVVIKRENGSMCLEGHNTDYSGFHAALRPMIAGREGLRALVAGTGGASKAVCALLSDLGIDYMILSRNPEQGLSYSSLDAKIMASHQLIINATPLGTSPNTDEAPAIPYEMLTPNHILIDLVYNPSLTLFMRKGLERGSLVRNGLRMLQGQAMAAWELWKPVTTLQS